MEHVLQGISDGRYSVASPLDENSEPPDAGVVTNPRLNGKNGKRKLADLPWKGG